MQRDMGAWMQRDRVHGCNEREWKGRKVKWGISDEQYDKEGSHMG